jgi:hypothetical protein
VTGGLRRLVALAATLAPARAARLLSRLDVTGGAEAARLAASLAGAPRRARLAALAAALPEDPAAAGTAPSHPLLRRIWLQRRSRAVAGRTLVRAAAAPRGAPP